MRFLHRLSCLGILALLMSGLTSCVSLLPELPTVSLTASPAFGVAPARLTFRTDIALSQGDAKAWRVQWDLGDGARAEGPQVEHVYQKAGQYQVLVQVSDEEGLSTERSLSVQVLNPPVFAAQRYPTGRAPLAVAVVDVNLDFQRDVISANSEGHNVSVFLAQGGELEQSRFAYRAIKAPSAAPQPSWMASGDFNRDGLPDLLVLNPPDDNLSLLFGNGLGGFAAPSGYSLKKPSRALVGDFNGDDNPDILVLGEQAGTSRLTLMVGRGTGEFHRGGVVLEKPWITDLAAGDVDRDGDLDVLVATQAFGVELILLENDGLGHFQSARDILLPVKPTALALDDFNGDGRLDAVTVNQDGSLSVLLGNGAGDFAPQEGLNPSLRGASRMVVGDLNRDGFDDLVVQHRRSGSGEITLLLGNGRGGFVPLPPVAGLEGGQFPVLADVNHDELPDLVLVDPARDEIVLGRNETTPR